MKARLAKKIACTPIDKLSPYWIKKFLGGKQDRRVDEAIKIVRRKRDDNRTNSNKL